MEPTRTCAVDGCERPAFARGWCGTHYNRWHKHGDPGGPEIKKFTFGMTAEERFAEYADTSAGPDACHPWTGPLANASGYGLLILPGGKRIGAHRWVCGQKIGRPLEPGEHAMHSCDNPPCVNPRHLSVGSPKDNTADMRRKGRGVDPPTARANTAKTHCKRGHELAGDNLLINYRGERQCRACSRLRTAECKARRKAKAST